MYCFNKLLKASGFKGFTLSELLVSLAVLGLIAGLTVPSVVTAVDRGRNRSALKEAFQTISAINQAGVLNGDFANLTEWTVGNATTPTGIVTYITSKLNYSKQCLETDTTSDGCKRGLTGQTATHSSNAHRARWILPNGVKVQASPSLTPAWSATAMVWTVTAKAFAADMVTTGTNPDTIVFSCNPSDVSQTINGIITKAGTCGAYDATTYATPFNLVLNG